MSLLQVKSETTIFQTCEANMFQNRFVHFGSLGPNERLTTWRWVIGVIRILVLMGEPQGARGTCFLSVIM